MNYNITYFLFDSLTVLCLSPFKSNVSIVELTEFKVYIGDVYFIRES